MERRPSACDSSVAAASAGGPSPGRSGTPRLCQTRRRALLFDDRPAPRRLAVPECNECAGARSQRVRPPRSHPPGALNCFSQRASP